VLPLLCIDPASPAKSESGDVSPFQFMLTRARQPATVRAFEAQLAAERERTDRSIRAFKSLAETPEATVQEQLSRVSLCPPFDEASHGPLHDGKRPFGPKQSEPGSAGSHETALKKFLSVSELALDREMNKRPLCALAGRWLNDTFGE